MNHKKPRNQIQKEKQPVIQVSVTEVKEGDIVKFKGTRNDSIRRVLKIYPNDDLGIKSLYCQVMIWKMSGFVEQLYTSLNGIDKLTHIYRDGNWVRVKQLD